MNKKMLLAIVAVAILVWGFWPHSHDDDVWTENKLSASYQEGDIVETQEEPIRQQVYLDVTGSMKPYYARDTRTSVVNSLSAIFGLIHRDSTQVFFLGSDRRYSGFANDILQTAYENNDRNTLRVTNFDKMFELAVANVRNNPGTIVYLLTDGIQSLNKPAYSMAEYLNELRGTIKSSFRNKKYIACAIFRYIGDFNGTYINCQEEHIADQHMQRPFYIIAIGQKENIRWLSNLGNDKMNKPDGTLFLGIHDFNGHKKAHMSKRDSTHLETQGGDVTLILELSNCMVNEIKPERCNVEGVANPSLVSKSKNSNKLEIRLPSSCGTHADNTSGLVKVSISMPYEIPDTWLNEWNTDDDTSGPDSIKTFGLSSLIKGIADGIQPDSVYFHTTFKYLP